MDKQSACYPKKSELTQADFNVSLDHPHLHGSLSMSAMESPDTPEAAPAEFRLVMTTGHPLVPQILTVLGPLVAQMLPIVLAALLTGGVLAPPAASAAK